MTAEIFVNQLRAYNAVLGALEALVGDICVECIMTKGARTRLDKGIKKLMADMDQSPLDPQEGQELRHHAAVLANRLQGLAQASEYT